MSNEIQLRDQMREGEEGEGVSKRQKNCGKHSVEYRKQRRGETKRGRKTTEVDNGTPFKSRLNSPLAPSYLLHFNRKCSFVSALPHSHSSSGEVDGRKGLVAPRSLKLRRRRERRVALRREREWMCLVKDGPGGRG
jgi:hypothetical protein